MQGSQPVFSPAYVSWQKGRVWVVTFISYTCFHLARKVRAPSPAALPLCCPPGDAPRREPGAPSPVLHRRTS